MDEYEAATEHGSVPIQAVVNVRHVRIAVLVAIVSALKKTPVQPALVILGDLSIQGNIKPVTSLAEPLQVAMENGARRALIPLGNKRNFLEVSGDIVEKVDPVFFSDPQMAGMKALGLV
jgi:ATP-dependent Lon protease